MRGLLTGLLLITLLAGCASTGDRRGTDAGDKQHPADINTQLGIEYMRKGMYEPSLEKLNKAVRQDPNHQLAQVSLAILYERLGELDKADRHYQKAYRIDNADPVALNAYGQFVCRRGDLQKAEELFARALKDPLYPNPELIYTNAGICALKKPDVEQAEGYFRSALKKNPRYPPALREMVKASFTRENFMATRAYLQRLQEVAQLTPEFLWIGVRAEYELQDVNARSSYALVLKNRYPESDEARELLQWERKLGER